MKERLSIALSSPELADNLINHLTKGEAVKPEMNVALGYQLFDNLLKGEKMNLDLLAMALADRELAEKVLKLKKVEEKPKKVEKEIIVEKKVEKKEEAVVKKHKKSKKNKKKNKIDINGDKKIDELDDKILEEIKAE